MLDPSTPLGEAVNNMQAVRATVVAGAVVVGAAVGLAAIIVKVVKRRRRPQHPSFIDRVASYKNEYNRNRSVDNHISFAQAFRQVEQMDTAALMGAVKQSAMGKAITKKS